MIIDQSWKQELEDIINQILHTHPLQINNLLSPKIIPSKKGIYLFTNISDTECIYVGQSNNVYQRICREHALGKRGSSSLREALLGLKVSRGAAVTTESDIDDYIKSNFLVRFYLEDNDTRRGIIECFLISLLKPKYSIPVVSKRRVRKKL